MHVKSFYFVEHVIKVALAVCSMFSTHFKDFVSLALVGANEES